MNYVKSYPNRSIVGGLIALVLVACGVGIYQANQHPSQGMVYGKNYNPASQYTTVQCSAYNNKGVCMVWMPITHYTPECYELTLRAEGDEWGVCVDPMTYERTQLESTYKVAS